MTKHKFGQFPDGAALSGKNRRHPSLYPAKRKCSCSHAQGRGPKRGIAGQASKGSPLRRFFQGIELAALRLGNKQNRQRQQKPRDRSNIKRKSPAMKRREMAAQKVTRSCTYRNREIKYSKNATALLFWKQVGHKSWSDRNESRFADADERVANEQFPICMGNRSSKCETAPGNSP